MSQPYAVLAVIPGNPAPQFSLVVADTPADALAGAAEAHVASGHEDAQLVGIFTASDLQQVVDALENIENQG